MHPLTGPKAPQGPSFVLTQDPHKHIKPLSRWPGALDSCLGASGRNGTRSRGVGTVQGSSGQFRAVRLFPERKWTREHFESNLFTMAVARGRKYKPIPTIDEQLRPFLLHGVLLRSSGRGSRKFPAHTALRGRANCGSDFPGRPRSSLQLRGSPARLRL